MLLSRRDEFLGIGGFDERYFLYAEDLDLCQRYRSRGFRLRTTDALAGIHRQGRSSSPDEGQPVFRAGWSLLGLIEYIARWNGQASARRAAAITLGTFRLQVGLLSIAGALGIKRATRKRTEIIAVDRFVRDRAEMTSEPAASEHCCHAARTALSEAAQPQRPRRAQTATEVLAVQSSGRRRGRSRSDDAAKEPL
jgi:hypothetical protein